MTKPFTLLPLYLRREVTTDAALRDYAKAAGIPIPRKLDVIAYRTPACVKRIARWGWHSPTKPTRRNKRVMLNCFAWQAVWMPDKA